VCLPCTVVSAVLNAPTQPRDFFTATPTHSTLLVDAVMGDDAAMTELLMASEELTRRMDENSQLARTAVQLAELCTHDGRQEPIAALTVTLS
jgi:hypothetical protein